MRGPTSLISRFQSLVFRPSRLILALTTVFVGHWLFADTLAHYQPQAAEPNTIRFAHFGSYQDYELWQKIINAYQSEHPELRVIQEYIPGWYGRYNAKVRQQIVSGTLPHVVLMQMASFSYLADHFARIDELAQTNSTNNPAADLAATGREAFSVPAPDGFVMRGVPVSGGSLVIYCNAACVDRASAFHGRAISLPDNSWTMDDFSALARDLTCDFDGDGLIDQFGFWRPRWLYYLPFLWSFGGDVLSAADGKWLLTGPHAEAAFDFYRDLARDRRVCPRRAEVPQLIQDVGFLTGKVAMCVNGPWFQPFLDKTRLRDTYIVAPIPTGPAGTRSTRITWDGLCIAGDLPAAQQRSAWRFVRFCISRRVQEMIADTGRAVPALREALNTFDRDGEDRRRGVFVDAMSYSRLQPVTKSFSKMDRTVNRHLERFIDEDADYSTAEFLDRLAGDEAITRAFGSGEAKSK